MDIPAVNPPPLSGPIIKRAPGYIGVLILLFFVAVTIGPLSYFFIWPNYVRSNLLKTGLQAEGQIVSVEPTGNYINNQPEARIIIDVTPKDGVPFRSETRLVVHQLSAPLYQPGKRVLVRYDVNDHSKMTIEYTEGI